MTVIWPDAAHWSTFQNYDLYTQTDHETWKYLYGTRLSQLSSVGSVAFLKGFEAVGLGAEYLPNLDDLNTRLSACSGWRIVPVNGFLPPRMFFNCLSNRLFPSTTYIRTKQELDYTKEPDIFHDLFGHIPMYAEPRYAAFVQQIGELSRRLKADAHIELLSRVFWFTVEFGLIRESQEIKIYGSGLVSSIADCEMALSAECVHLPFTLDGVLGRPVQYDRLQTVLFVIESYDELSHILNEVRRRLLPNEVD